MSAIATTTDSVIDRLEDQISWYDRKSGSSQRAYKRIKIAEIIAAAVIPFASAFNNDFHYAAYITGALGVIITILEGLLHLNQYQENWAGYRSTCEALKHEKYCFLAKAADYAHRCRSTHPAGRAHRIARLAGTCEMVGHAAAHE